MSRSGRSSVQSLVSSSDILLPPPSTRPSTMAIEVSTAPISSSSSSGLESAVASLSLSTVKLQSSDGKVFEVTSKVARLSVTIRTMLDDLNIKADDPEPIPLANVPAHILSLVLKWAEQHQNEEPVPVLEEEEDEEEKPVLVGEWDKSFLSGLDHSTLFELITAANFLDVKGLMAVACKTVADMLTGKTPEEIRKEFDIEDDLSEEEKERIRKDIEWLDQK